MSKNEHCTRVKCNLLQAEVFVRFPVRICGKDEVVRFCELQEVQNSDGITEKLVEVDYPITAESLNSYADSADYKKNPDVITKAQPRQNMGDISELQKVLRNDMSAMRDMLATSQEVMKKLEQLKSQESTEEPAKEPVKNIEKE